MRYGLKELRFFIEGSTPMVYIDYHIISGGATHEKTIELPINEFRKDEHLKVNDYGMELIKKIEEKSEGEHNASK
ncbi:hypothetical protein [Virgibacillus sp. Bac332]|uniref:hypothetical protein n=1 Tax=Virgibacillus sp. Bac332 TaxID=2419842 RepID=UPI000EF463E0|nr:hypothetical protein [Virgibacillus sp. Bac332]